MIPGTIPVEFEFCSKFRRNHLFNLAGPSAKFDSSGIPGIARILPDSGRNQWRTIKTSLLQPSLSIVFPSSQPMTSTTIHFLCHPSFLFVYVDSAVPCCAQPLAPSDCRFIAIKKKRFLILHIIHKCQLYHSKRGAMWGMQPS